ncbi:MAG: hypothetical protein F6K42_02905 [Leptolyngbya sp. SIO1D8]|nr:hypothetical protein [Leptolyngbya sp. SIO1D8]
MNPKLEEIFAEPGKAYLRPEELSVFSRFVSSLPERINVYRRLRSDELSLMQAVADALQQQFPQESEERLKRSIQNGILILRCSAMAMLMDNPDFVTKRLETWLPETIEIYGTQAINETLYQLIKQQLSQRFTPQQRSLLFPGIDSAKALFPSHKEGKVPVATDDTLVSLF